MSYYKTEGIVLRRTNLGEADRIITFLTPDHGKLKAVAKGVRRIKSRMAGHLELFSRVNLMLATGRNLDIITSARLADAVNANPADYNNVSYGYLFAEMLDRLLDEGVENTELYQTVQTAYAHLAASGPSALLELAFKLRLLNGLGYHPYLDGCTVCHTATSDVDYYFSLSAGGIVDANCVIDRSHPLSLNQIKLWRLILAHPLEQVKGLTGAEAEAATTLLLANDFYDYTFGKRFISQELLGHA
jgi:DNA repair protein RecO (recombination protein O)